MPGQPASAQVGRPAARAHAADAARAGSRSPSPAPSGTAARQARAAAAATSTRTRGPRPEKDPPPPLTLLISRARRGSAESEFSAPTGAAGLHPAVRGVRVGRLARGCELRAVFHRFALFLARLSPERRPFIDPQRQDHLETGPVRHRRFVHDVAAVGASVGSGDREPETRALRSAPRLRASREAVKEAGDELAPYAFSPIFDRETQVRVAPCGRDGDRRPAVP